MAPRATSNLPSPAFPAGATPEAARWALRDKSGLCPDGRSVARGVGWLHRATLSACCTTPHSRGFTSPASRSIHMAIRHQRSVGFGLSSALCAFVLAACAAPAEPARPGALELRVEPEASYALVGRFHVNAIDPYSPSRDVDFDAATSR